MGLRPKYRGHVHRENQSDVVGFFVFISSFRCPSLQYVWQVYLHEEAGCRSQVRIATQLSIVYFGGALTLWS